MKTNCFNTPVIILFLLPACSVQEKVITADDLSEGRLVVIGLVEYDFTHLDNKKIKGIELFFDSKQEHSDFALSEKYLPDEADKKYQFICKIGSVGEYELCCNKNTSYTPETNNLLTLMGQQRSENPADKNTLQKYDLNGGKIINIGKIVVTYSGGTVENGSTKYSYSFQTVGNDTIALHAFKLSYPLIFEKFRNDIYSF
jgi:hypothetical protein